MVRHLPYIIIGAGIAGLSLAYRLKKSGIDFLLVEQKDKPGGNWQSHSYKSSIYEFGPNSFMNRSVELEEMIDTIGFRDQVLNHPFSKSSRYLYHKNKLINVKSNPLTILGSDLLSLESKLRIPLEIFLRNKPKSQDESVYEFFSRRFGTEIADITDAALQGVWAGDSRKLSAKSALKKLYEAERKYGSLMSSLRRQVVAQRRPGRGNPALLQSCSFKNGMQSFCVALSNWLGVDKVLFNSKTKIIEKLNQGYKLEINGEVYNTDNLVIASKAFEAANLIEAINPKLSLILNSIYYAPIALFAYTLPKNIFKDANVFNAFGYINAKKDFLTLGTIFSSQLFPERELEDEYLLLSFAGGAKHREILDYSLEKLSQEIYQEQISIVNPYAHRPLELNDFKTIESKLIKHAIPQYQIGYSALESIIEEELKNLPGLVLSGNYRGGVAIADVIKQSFAIKLALC